MKSKMQPLFSGRSKVKTARRFFVVLLLVCNWQYIRCQSLFAPDSSRWTQHVGFWFGQGGVITTHIYYDSEVMLGDTVVAGKTLQKLYAAGTNKIDTVCHTLSSYFFNDSGKIYIGSYPDSLKMAYNYNLNKGDSFPIIGKSVNGNYSQTYYPIVDSVRTVFFAGRNRKWIRFSLLPYNTRVIWLEGVGDINYGLVWNYYSIMLFRSFGNPLNGSTCFYDGGNHAMNGVCSYTNCTLNGIPVGPEGGEAVSVYPIPCTNKLTICTSETIERVRLVNAVGSTCFETVNGEIDVVGMPAGVYFLHITSGEKIISRKIVIQH